MKVIKILGTGCPNCSLTEKMVSEVVSENNIEAKVIKVTDIQDIVSYNVLSLPTIVINEEVVLTGKVPNKDDIKKLLNV
ncbi:thioredoxin family protein [Lutibacter sp.]